MSKLKEKIQLSAAEVTELKLLVSKGKHPVRKVKRAQILLKLDEAQSHIAIAQAVGVSLATVYNIHDRYLADKLNALEEKARTGQPRKVTPQVEAAVTRIACSQAPAGKVRWTVSLINERMVALGHELNDETVRLILKKAGLSLG
ncbi:MAG: helix-turn-helix domain-containing protein [Adhaeribacter sp.]